jgi:Holliday junction resolvase RusA-like endonuclease
VNAKPRHWTPAKRVTIQATLWHKTNRRRDGDNALASLKAAFDGLVDAGILADDSGVTHLPVIFKTGTPKIELEVTVIE